MTWLSRNRTPAAVLGLAGVLFVLGFWGYQTSDGAAKARERDARLEQALSEGPSEVGASLEVSFLTIGASLVEDVVELAGVLEPIRATWVAAELAGRVLEVPAEEHAQIEQGALLVRLDPALPRAELVRAQAAHKLAKQELERQQRLGSRSVASQAELDRARAEERRSYAALLEARTRLEYTQITAPFAGLVNSLDLDPGAYVQPGTRIAEVLDVSTIEVEVPVSDRQIGAISVGDTARVRVDALGSERIEGRVVRVGRAPQEETQRYPVIVELANSEGQLLPGMLAEVSLRIGGEASIRLPAIAVQREFELDYVYVLDAEGAIRRTRIRTRPVPFRPDQIEVREGLAEGDRVATSSIALLRDGMRVRPQ